MISETSQCATCGRLVTRTHSLFGDLCPACVLGAGRTPGAASPGTHDTTTWAEAFPQLEVDRVLAEEGGLTIFRTRVLDREPPEAAILQILEGNALRETGGPALIEARMHRLASASLDGVAEVLDFGDLGNAYFLLTSAPELLRPADEDNPKQTYPAVLPGARQTLQAAWAKGITLSLHPETIFSDRGSGRTVWTPALRLDDGSDSLHGDAPLHQPLPGQTLGRYTLLEQAGEGGFGEVWKARQERPVEREVAVKVLKTGLHSQRARARFEIEQRALAKLDHPHITRYLEGGTTRDGRPYFVMEWVEGRSLTRECQETKAALPERLRLFRQAAEAVHHAHQKGLLHRDLKPSNVMVGRNGACATVKVIDFGIAQMLDDPSIDQTRLTLGDEVLGTPASMSPEQAAGAGAVDLDARTDVYGLGVLLYELLTDRLPFDPKLPPDELRRSIRDIDPPKPSVRADPERARPLRGELDWIVMRCLEKDPGRRYPSVSALLRDLDRHENHEPVEAGPPEAAYRFRKFVQRNKVVVGAALAIFVVLLAATAVSLVHAKRAAAMQAQARAAEVRAELRAAEAIAEKEDADRVSEFLVEVFESPLPENEGRDLSAVSLLDAAARRLRADKTMAPERKATFLRHLVGSYDELGLRTEAVDLAEESLAYHQDQLGQADAGTIEAQVGLAYIKHSAGLYEDAEHLINDALIQLQGGDYDRSLLLSAKFGSAILRFQRGETVAAVVDLEEIVAGLPKGDPDRIRAEGILANQLSHIGQRDRSIQLAKSVAEQQRVAHGDHHPKTLISIRNLAGVYNRRFDFHEAVAALEPVIPHFVEVFGEDHFSAIGAKKILAHSLFRSGRKDEAIRLSEEVLGGAERVLGPDHPFTSIALNELGLNLQKVGKISRAKPLLERAYQSNLKRGGWDDSDTLATAINLFLCYLQTNEDDAMALIRDMRRGLAPRQESGLAGEAGTAHLLPETLPPELAKAMSATENPVRLPELGLTVFVQAVVNALTDREEWEMAIPFMEAQLVLLYGIENDRSSNRRTVLGNLSVVYSKVGRCEDALTVGRFAWSSRRNLLGESHPATMAVARQFGDILRETGRLQESLNHLQECLDTAVGTLPPTDPEVLHLENSLVLTLCRLHMNDEALEVADRRLSKIRDTLPKSHPDRLRARYNRASILIKTGGAQEALEELQELILELKGHPQHADLSMDARGEQARAHVKLHQYAEAALLIEGVIGEWKEKASVTGHIKSWCWVFLGSCYAELGQFEKTIAQQTEYLDLLESTLGPESKTTIQAEYHLAVWLAAAGKHREAVDRYTALLARLPEDCVFPHRISTLSHLLNSHRALGDSAALKRVSLERRSLLEGRMKASYGDIMDELDRDAIALVQPNANWRWLDGSAAADSGGLEQIFDKFAEPDFDDSSWELGQDSRLGGFGRQDYDDQWLEETHLAPQDDGHGPRLALFRTAFTNVDQVFELELHLQHDDGVIVFLDGQEVARENVRPGPLSADLGARVNRSHGLEWEVARVTIDGHLEPGEHVLAIALVDYDCWHEDLRIAGIRLVGANRMPILPKGRKLNDALHPALRSGLDLKSEDVQEIFAELGQEQLAEPAESLELFRTAIVLAMGDSTGRYEQFCKGFARVHGEADDQIVRNRIRLAAMLRPTPETTAIWQLLPSKRGEQSVPAWAERWFDLTEALGCYRLGDGLKAITCLKRTSRPMPDKYSANDTLPVLFTLLEAMANHQLGNDGDARTLFAKARAQMPGMRDRNPIGSTDQWQDRLLCEILFEEAEALIVPKQ